MWFPVLKIIYSMSIYYVLFIFIKPFKVELKPSENNRILYYIINSKDRNSK